MLEVLRGRRSLLAAVLFLLSAFVITFKIASPARFEIVVDVEGTVVVAGIPQVYGLVDVVTVAAFALVAGVTAYYLVRSGRETHAALAPVARVDEPKEPLGQSPRVDATVLVARLLEGETRKVYQTVLKHGGEILQRELVLESNLPKATVSRALSYLEAKGLITRAPHGLTNKVVAIRVLEDLLGR